MNEVIRSEISDEVKDKGEKKAVFSPFPLVPFLPALQFWLWLGFVSFGGPAGQIALMHRELVERKRWVDEEKFLHALNFCMLLPGPEAQQLATYNGWRLHGFKGGIVAGAFFVLPSVFILLALSYLYAVYGNLPVVSGILDGLKAVVLAIVVEAVFKIGKRALKNWRQWTTAAVAFAAIYFLQIKFPIIVLIAAILGFFASNQKAEKSQLENQSFKVQNWKFKIAQPIFVCTVLWLVPLVFSGLMFGWQSLPVRVYLFFTGAAFVTFGGAYAVLAYVNQAAVNSFGWITTQQAIDGFALAETTPGPLIMVLQFIGFMTGWNHAPENQNQTFFAVVCALLTTFATFLPSFLFIFAFAPFVEELQNNPRLKAILASVTAAVVGVISTLAVTFGATVIFVNNSVNWLALLISAASFVALFRFHLNALWLILLGALLGCGTAWLQS